jgi:predicted N-acetyltransferase YhbS
MATIRKEAFRDASARERLLDRVWGALRFAKTAERLREDRIPADDLSFVATEGRSVVGTIRLWDICAGPDRPALLLGPLAVDEAWRGQGIGSALMRRAMATARRRGRAAMLLVGDAPYYGRFGFSAEKTEALWLPGPFEPSRLLGHEIMPGALDGARGLVSATGRTMPTPNLGVLIARIADADSERRAA